MAVHHCHLKANGDWKGGASAPKAPPLNPPLYLCTIVKYYSYIETAQASNLALH